MKYSTTALLLLNCAFFNRAAVVKPIPSEPSKGYEWSAQKIVELDSPSGKLQAAKQTLTIRHSGEDGDLSTYEFVSVDGFSGALFSRKCDSYAVQDGRVIGITIKRGDLVVRLPNIDTSGDLNASLNSLIVQNEDDVYELKRFDNATRYSINKIFGDVVFAKGYNANMGALGDRFSINTVTVSQNSLRISIGTASKRLLELNLNSALKIESATEDGKTVRVICSGVSGVSEPWLGPTKRPFVRQNENGGVIIGRERAFEYVDEDGEEHTGFFFSGMGRRW